jgi:hypothetical protein
MPKPLAPDADAWFVRLDPHAYKEFAEIGKAEHRTAAGQLRHEVAKIIAGRADAAKTTD